jgi:OPA family glycerol-3-phosphate transporter-like MFS transporter
MLTLRQAAKYHSAQTRRTFRAAQWRMLLATMLCYLFYYTGRQTLGFAFPGIEKELRLDKVTLGWINACMLWCYAIGQAVNGNLGDKFGGRRMMSLGGIASCVMNWVMSFGTTFASLQIPWAINGYVQSMGWAPGSRLLCNWWDRSERGKVYGLYVFSSGLSSILAFVTSTAILAMGLNWRWIFRIPVLLMAMSSVAFYLIVRDEPRELGFPSPDQDEDATSNSDCEGTLPDETVLHRYKSVLKHGRFRIASLAIGFQSAARYGLLTWIPVHYLNTNNPNAKWITVALPTGMALGPLCSGWISDKCFRDRRYCGIFLFMLLAAASAISMFLLPFRFTAQIGLLFLCGFFTFGPQSAYFALCPELLGSSRAGTGTGIMDMCAYFFAGLSGPLIGWIIQSHSNHTALIFPIVAISCTLSALVSLFIRK